MILTWLCKALSVNSLMPESYQKKRTMALDNYTVESQFEYG